MLPTKKQFQKSTSVWGRRKNPLLLRIDTLLDRYQASQDGNINQTIRALQALLEAINDWLESKEKKIHKMSDSRTSGVIQLMNQVEAELQRLSHGVRPIVRRTRKVTIPGMCAKRTSFDNVNIEKHAGPVREVDILQGATHHLSIREAIWRSALTSGPWSKRRKGRIAIQQINAAEGHRLAHPESHPDCITAIDVAERAISKARKLLPMGALNNRRVANHPPTWSKNPAWQNALNEALASELVLNTGKRDPEDFVAWLAAFAQAATTTGGGVCTYISALTCGILTTIAPANTEVLLVYSTADHQFCVISHNKSPWFTVDPWTLNSYVLRWERSYFGPGEDPRGGIDNYFKVTIHNPIETPYGIRFNPNDVKNHLMKAQSALGPKTTDNMAHNFGHCCNAPNLNMCGMGRNMLDGRPPVQTFLDWG